MKNNTVIEMLNSMKLEKVSTCLYELSAIDEVEVSDEIQVKVLELFCHLDPEIRKIAIRTAALHWKNTEAFNLLSRMFINGPMDENEEVLEMAVSSLDGYARIENIGLEKVSRLQCYIIKELNCDVTIKSLAYVGLLRNHNKIDNKEYAKLNLDYEDIIINEKVVEKISNTL